MVETTSPGELCIVGCKQFDNKVEELLKEIARIQAECKHKWVLASDIVLKESKVKDVYIVGDASRGSSEGKIFERKCALCSQKKSASASNVCVRCLHEIGEGGGLRHREEYFGERHLYFAARRGYCANCGLSVVWDEWDQ